MPATASLLSTVLFLSQSAQAHAARSSGVFVVDSRKTPESVGAD